jgi:dihydropteroate synthase
MKPERPRSQQANEGAAVQPERCAIWGVLNVTPDSFSDGGRFMDVAAAVRHGKRLLDEGADVLDVGGESSRPAGRAYGSGFSPVSAGEEIARVVPVVECLVRELRARVSIDTVKPEVAAAAFRAGASIVNDVRCVASTELAREAAAAGAEYVVMHSRGLGELSADNTDYPDLVGDVLDALRAAAVRVEAQGVPRASVWIDPGLGFAKSAKQSLELLGSLGRFVETGYRVLVGASRKSFIAEFAPLPNGDRPGPAERLGGSVAAVTLSALAGVHAVRVHDVHEARQAVRLVAAMRHGAEGPS